MFHPGSAQQNPWNIGRQTTLTIWELLSRFKLRSIAHMKAKTLQVPHMEAAPHIANHHEGILPEKKHLVVCFDQYWQATIMAALLLHIVDHCNVTRHLWHLVEK